VLYARHTELAAAVADQHFVLHDERRHRHRLATIDVAELNAPDFGAALGVDRDGLVIERVEEQAAVGIREAAVDEVAASNARGGG
jgi:hypothetical protein